MQLTNNIKIMDFTKINWDVFLLTEKTNLKKALDKGDYKVLTNLIEEMTQEKEIELQKIVNVFRAGADDYSSEVRKDMEEKFHSKSFEDLTPEEEMEWQKKLDAEKEKMKKEVVEKSEEKKKEIIDSVLEEPKVEEPKVEEPKKRGRKPNNIIN